MRIAELQPGQKIQLQVRVKDNTLTFDSVVQESNPKKSSIVADAVMKDDKAVSLRGNGIIVDVIVYFKDTKPVIFKNTHIQLCKKGDGQFCYMITTITEGQAFNRRGSFRCYVGINTNIQFGANTATRPGMIHDVSISGFSVTCDPKDDIPTDIGRLVHVVLNDQPQPNGNMYNFQLYGLIVRTVTMENGKLLIGCALNSPVAGMDRYIMEKERIRLKNTPGRL